MTTETIKPPKPLGRKAYGSIGHLPGSRLGTGDHHITGGQAEIALQGRAGYEVYVQEKLDGACTSVAKIDGHIVPLQRAGYLANTSPYEHLHLFHDWAMEHRAQFDVLLGEGERAVGEWLAMAHGTRYNLRGREPFVLFDIMRGIKRATVEQVVVRALEAGFTTPAILSTRAMSIPEVISRLGHDGRGHHGAIDLAEGAVWRVEDHKGVNFLGKYVRPEKVDGCYFADEPLWNWRPEGVPFAEAAGG